MTDASGVTITAPQPPTTPVPQPPMPPAPAPAATPTPMPTPMSDGGVAAQNSWKSFFSAANWVEIGFMALGVTAFMFMVKYYRHKLNADREMNKKLQLQIDDIQAQMAAMKTKKKPSVGGTAQSFVR